MDYAVFAEGCGGITVGAELTILLLLLTLFRDLVENLALVVREGG